MSGSAPIHFSVPAMEAIDAHGLRFGKASAETESVAFSRISSSFALRQRKGDCVEAEGRLYRAIVIVAEGRKGKYP